MSKTKIRSVALVITILSSVAWAGCDSRVSAVKMPPAPEADQGPQMTVDMAPDMMVEPEVPRGPMAGLSPMRLLTRYEYDRTLTALLGFEVATSKMLSFPSENLVDGFENNAWSHRVSPLLLSKYMEAGEQLGAKAVTQHADKLPQCDVASTGAQACGAAFLAEFLPRAFRRPPTDDERAHFEAMFTRELERRAYPEALSLVIAAILQSPQFLYRVETFEAAADQAPPQDGGMNAQEFELVGPYEMANRLSYFLWASMPDEALFEAAKNNALSTPEQIKAQIQRMLADDRAKSMVHEFHRQWLGLKSLDTLVKEGSFFPLFEQSMRDDYRESLNAFIDYAYWEDGSFDALMTSNMLFLTPDLAPLLGVEVPADAQGIFRYAAPINERTGIMTQPALLAILANANQSSPIQRGIFVRERMLCQHVPPPPNDMQIVPPDPDPNATTREIFAIHTANESCAGCHALIDPLGFGFEAFDGVGKHRLVENGLAVDASGELTASPDPALNGKFDGIQELAARLAAGDLTQSCLTKQWFQFALGRPHDESDQPSIDAIQANFKASGYRWSALFESIALSDSFRYRRKDQSPTSSPSDSQ